MTVETYAEHAENGAWALNRLLGEDSIPAETAAVDQLLHYREAVIDALRQRLYGVGLNTWYPARNLPAPAPGLNLEGIDNKLATLLHNIALSMPNLPIDERPSPLEALGTACTDPVVETWREAAIELLAATHALDSAEDKPWLRDHGAGWHLTRQVARCDRPWPPGIGRLLRRDGRIPGALVRRRPRRPPARRRLRGHRDPHAEPQTVNARARRPSWARQPDGRPVGAVRAPSPGQGPLAPHPQRQVNLVTGTFRSGVSPGADYDRFRCPRGATGPIPTPDLTNERYRGPAPVRRGRRGW
jgi:hypothetical protein